jgi:hypothetical protein
MSKINNNNGLPLHPMPAVLDIAKTFCLSTPPRNKKSYFQKQLKFMTRVDLGLIGLSTIGTIPICYSTQGVLQHNPLAADYKTQLCKRRVPADSGINLIHQRNSRG